MNELPYKIERFPAGRVEVYDERVDADNAAEPDPRKRRPRKLLRVEPARMVPMKVYAGGLTVEASPEEVAVWDRLQAAEKELAEAHLLPPGAEPAVPIPTKRK